MVVSYSISTSNHNSSSCCHFIIMLYLIPFLHQTTTQQLMYEFPNCCILFHFYIKPQPKVYGTFVERSCILFHFYIKPQHATL